MTTREEMAEALHVAAEADRRNADTMWQCGMREAGSIAYRQRELALDTASQLKRDGELRERLANLCATARTAWHPEAAALAARVEALLKEFQ